MTDGLVTVEGVAGGNKITADMQRRDTAGVNIRAANEC